MRASFVKTMSNHGTIDFTVETQSEWESASAIGIAIHFEGSTPFPSSALLTMVILSPAVNGLSLSWFLCALPTMT